MISLAGKRVHPSKGFFLDALTLARHLGRIPRFGGTLDTWWSVLQHSLFVSAMMEADGCTSRECLVGLLHDAHEFLRGDTPTDWKVEADQIQADRIDKEIERALALTPFTDVERAAVKPYDHAALIVEGNIPAALCCEILPEKFDRPDIVAEYVVVFRKFYVRDTLTAFLRCWNESYFPRMFVDTFERLKGT